MKHVRPAASLLPPVQQSRSFNGLLRHLSRLMNAMIRTARLAGWSNEKIRGMVRNRASNLRSMAIEWEHLADRLI